MKTHNFWFFAITMFFLIACDKNENNIEEPPADFFLFEDGFETQNNSLNTLSKSIENA